MEMLTSEYPDTEWTRKAGELYISSGEETDETPSMPEPDLLTPPEEILPAMDE